MTLEFYELENVEEITNALELTTPRAIGLYRAIHKQRDVFLIKMFRCYVDSAFWGECLVVEVICDEVPSQNKVGILCRERLAICVPNHNKKLVEVLALRRNFPVLMHQNQGRYGGPASLCLYFESAEVVQRTWTPEAFLKRIQWWLEKSAQGTLHPTDQPVEQLFFRSSNELVLPWDIEKLLQNPDQQFSIMQGPERPEGERTYFLIPINCKSKNHPTTNLVYVPLPPIIHGLIEREPSNLGQLSDILHLRGVDFLKILRQTIQTRLEKSNTRNNDDDQFTILLLEIPIRRTLDATPEKTFFRAFFLETNYLKLGISCNALTVFKNRYFPDARPVSRTDWRDFPVCPLEVLLQNSGKAARQQSGIQEIGPNGVIIGVGSLGSMLLNLWGRSGWGNWSVIDNDHLKPHNLSRHTAYALQIGIPKAQIVANLHSAVMQGATNVTPIVANACDLSLDAVSTAINQATLVIDASTGLEYPRLASKNDNLPRHFSVFITPNGNSAVLLAEDLKRTKRLRTLEAQYYRALVEQPWGQYHLQEHLGKFWSGASCRDISFVMPYSRIVAHAGSLAEQIQIAAECNEALIRVWQRDPLRGSVEVYDVLPLSEQCLEFGDLSLYIDDGVLQQLQLLRQKALPNETGGVLLGYYDFNIQAVVIVLGLPAPLDSKASPTSFERGIDSVAAAVKAASDRTAGIVRYVGEWHSHPPKHSASPSKDDLFQMINLTIKMDDEGLPAIQIIIGENDITISQGVAR